MRKLKKSVIAVFWVVALSACATGTHIPFQGPNGQDAYSLKCSGLGRTLEQCYREASTLCPSGYNLIGQHSGSVGVPSGAGVIVAPKHSLVIECKPL